MAHTLTPTPAFEEPSLLYLVHDMFLNVINLRSHLLDQGETHPLLLALAQRVEEASSDAAFEIEKAKPSKKKTVYFVTDAYHSVVDLWSYMDKLKKMSIYRDDIAWSYIDSAMGFANDLMREVEK